MSCAPEGGVRDERPGGLAHGFSEPFRSLRLQDVAETERRSPQRGLRCLHLYTKANFNGKLMENMYGGGVEGLPACCILLLTLIQIFFDDLCLVILLKVTPCTVP